MRCKSNFYYYKWNPPQCPSNLIHQRDLTCSFEIFHTSGALDPAFQLCSLVYRIMQNWLFKIQISATFGYSVKWIPRLWNNWLAGWETGDWQSNWSNVPSVIKGSCSICINLKVSAIQSSFLLSGYSSSVPSHPNMKMSEEQNAKASFHGRSTSCFPMADLGSNAQGYKYTLCSADIYHKHDLLRTWSYL